jgi:hypothetical protein
MIFDWGTLFGMALQTVPEPRKVARDIFSLAYPRIVLWQVLALILVGSSFMGVISSILFPVDPEMMGPLFASPLLLGVSEASVSVLTVFAIYWIGRMAGGQGRFEDALLTVIWLQFVLLLVEIGVLFLGVFAPTMAMLLWVMGGALGFWILTHFIAEMHEFRSAGMVFVGIILTIFVTVVVMSVVLAVIGVGADTRPGEF